MVGHTRRGKQPDARSVTSAKRTVPASGEVGGADQTGLGTQLRDPQLGRRPVPVAGQAGAEGGRRGSAQQLTRCGYPTTDDEHSWIQDRGQPAQSPAQPCPDHLEALQCGELTAQA